MIGPFRRPPDDGRDAFDRLYRNYSRILQGFFMRRVRDRSEAEDLTHDLLLKIAQRTDIQTLDHPEGYLFAAAANSLRDRARHQKIVDTYARDAACFEERIEGLSPERVIQSRQSLQRLMSAVETMEPRVKDVFVLHKLEGMKYSEIAKLYGLSVSSIEKYMIRAIAHLALHAEPGA